MSDNKLEYYFKEGCYIEEWQNSAEQPDMSIVRVRVEANTSTLLHLLHHTEERYIILSGSGIVTVGEKSWRVSPKDIVNIPAGEAQMICNDNDEELLFLAICTPRFVPENYEELPAS
ncbi:MAG: cupin domain-containing protein [Pseudomonadota bacterium]